MREFLTFVVSELVDRPETLVLRQEARDGVTHYLLDLPASELGKVIGKQGHTIRAIRNLLVAAASRHGQQCTFEIVERAPIQR